MGKIVGMRKQRAFLKCAYQQQVIVEHTYYPGLLTACQALAFRHCVKFSQAALDLYVDLAAARAGGGDGEIDFGNLADGVTDIHRAALHKPGEFIENKHHHRHEGGSCEYSEADEEEFAAHRPVEGDDRPAETEQEIDKVAEGEQLERYAVPAVEVRIHAAIREAVTVHPDKGQDHLDDEDNRDRNRDEPDCFFKKGKR